MEKKKEKALSRLLGWIFICLMILDPVSWGTEEEPFLEGWARIASAFMLQSGLVIILLSYPLLLSAIHPVEPFLELRADGIHHLRRVTTLLNQVQISNLPGHTCADAFQ